MKVATLIDGALALLWFVSAVAIAVMLSFSMNAGWISALDDAVRAVRIDGPRSGYRAIVDGQAQTDIARTIDELIRLNAQIAHVQKNDALHDLKRTVFGQLVWAYQQAGDFASSERIARTWVEFDDDDLEAAAELAGVQMLAPKTRALGEATFIQLNTKDPESLLLADTHATALARTGDLAGALSRFTRFLPGGDALTPVLRSPYAIPIATTFEVAGDAGSCEHHWRFDGRLWELTFMRCPGVESLRLAFPLEHPLELLVVERRGFDSRAPRVTGWEADGDGWLRKPARHSATLTFAIQTLSGGTSEPQGGRPHGEDSDQESGRYSLIVNLRYGVPGTLQRLLAPELRRHVAAAGADESLERLEAHLQR
jgi:hypothetical protein